MPGRGRDGHRFGFLAVVISYLPVLYQAFSRREVTISLLDARAGSPPTAAELLGRLARFSDLERLDRSSASGSDGRPRCSRATSRSRS